MQWQTQQRKPIFCITIKRYARHYFRFDRYNRAFSAAQGAIGLFAGENENLQKIMLKVQSLMAITIGLQQIEQMLNKDSAFTLVVEAKAKTMLAAATSGLAAALGVSTVAAQALLATLTLGLSAAITAMIVLVSKYVVSQKKLKSNWRIQQSRCWLCV